MGWVFGFVGIGCTGSRATERRMGSCEGGSGKNWRISRADEVSRLASSSEAFPCTKTSAFKHRNNCDEKL